MALRHVVFMLVLVLVALEIQNAEAKCCRGSGGKFSWKKMTKGGGTCKDDSASSPCCGVGKCNYFCCNCKDGCRKKLFGIFRRSVDDLFEFDDENLNGDAMNIIAMADQDQDGRLSFDEVHDYMENSPLERSKRHAELSALDLNGDFFFTADEIDPEY